MQHAISLLDYLVVVQTIFHDTAHFFPVLATLFMRYFLE